MRVDIHAARHDDHPAGIERRNAVRQRGYDPSILDADIADLAVHALRGVVHRAADDAKPGRLAHGVCRPERARSAPSSRMSVSAAPRGVGRTGVSGRGTSSIR